MLKCRLLILLCSNGVGTWEGIFKLSSCPTVLAEMPISMGGEHVSQRADKDPEHLMLLSCFLRQYCARPNFLETASLFYCWRLQCLALNNPLSPALLWMFETCQWPLECSSWCFSYLQQIHSCSWQAGAPTKCVLPSTCASVCWSMTSWIISISLSVDTCWSEKERGGPSCCCRGFDGRLQILRTKSGPSVLRGAEPFLFLKIPV